MIRIIRHPLLFIVLLPNEEYGVEFNYNWTAERALTYMGYEGQMYVVEHV